MKAVNRKTIEGQHYLFKNKEEKPINQFTFIDDRMVGFKLKPQVTQALGLEMAFSLCP